MFNIHAVYDDDDGGDGDDSGAGQLPPHRWEPLEFPRAFSSPAPFSCRSQTQRRRDGRRRPPGPMLMNT